MSIRRFALDGTVPTRLERAPLSARDGARRRPSLRPWQRLGASAAVLALASGLLLGLAPGGNAAAVSEPLPSTAGAVGIATSASIDHIVVIVMENHSSSAIVGSSKAPYLNSLIARYGLATRYTAVAHPSEPNYLALFSGSTQGVRDDGVHTLSGRSLADQLEAVGRTWRVVAENVPTSCYRGATAYGGADGLGWYARKHNPAISFSNISRNASRCANIVNMKHFSLTAANFQLVVPNMCHDMHDCSVATGDAFLKRFLAPVVANPAFAHTLVFITWDEGTDSTGGGGRVATIAVGPTVRPGVKSTVAHTHYSLLRTVENIWGLGCLNRTCSANDLREMLR